MTGCKGNFRESGLLILSPSEPQKNGRDPDAESIVKGEGGSQRSGDA